MEHARASMRELTVCRIGATVIALVAGWVSVANAQPAAVAAESRWTPSTSAA